jgi:protein-S-isoprenylcysteine O-methyltransferase Ste14
MNIGNRIKKSPVKEMRDSIWAEGSRAVDDEPWNYVRHFLLISVRISVIESNTLIRLIC